MKSTLTALIFAAFLVPAALAQPASATDNVASIGAQMNFQKSPGYGPLSSSGPAPKPAAFVPAPAYYPHAGAPFLGGKALVNNNVDVGTQLNVQNGDGNVAFNDIGVSQSGAAFGGPSDGALVNNNIRVNTQLNIQNGRGNFADNASRSAQLGLAVAP
jgi:hypothetical protein